MNKRKLTGEAITYGLGRAMEGAAAFIVLPFAGRILGPAQYGTADIITATTSLLFLLIGLNFTQALTRYFYDVDSPTLAATHAAVIALNGTIVVLLGLLALYIFRDQLTHHLAWIAALLVIPAHVFSEHVATIFRLRHEPFKYLCVVAASMGAWVIATPLMLVVWQAGIKSLFIGKLVGFALGIAVAAFWLIRVYQPRINVDYIKMSLRFTLPMLPATLAAWGMLHGPRYMLGIGAGVEEVGFYGIAVRFNYILTLTGMAGLMAWMPFAMGIKGDPNARRILGRGVLAFTVVNVAIAIVLAAFAYEEVLLLLGAEYRPAGKLIGPMLIASVLYNIGMMHFTQISISERTHWQSISYGIGFAAMVIANMILIPQFQSLGAVFGLVLGQGAGALIMIVIAQRVFPVDSDLIRVGGLLVVLAIVAAGGWWLEALTATRMSAIAWKSALTVCGLIGCLAVLGRSELERAAGIVRDVVGRRVPQ